MYPISFGDFQRDYEAPSGCGAGAETLAKSQGHIIQENEKKASKGVIRNIFLYAVNHLFSAINYMRS